MSASEPQVAKREIDLAGAPVRRFVWLLRLLVRSCQIVFWLGVSLARLPLLRITKGSWSAAFGASIAFFFQRLGATFIKVGQIMSTRPDIFPASFLTPFFALQDRVPPFSFADVRRTIEEDFGRRLEDIFVEFGPEPVASASIAQVHRAVLQEAELPPTFAEPIVAVKVRRPGIVRRAYLDEALLRFGARCVSLVPTFSLISPVEAVSQFCEAVNKQLDFTIEAENSHRFRKNFESERYVVFPALVEQLCSDRVLTMEFIEGVKEDKIKAIGNDPSFLARKGLEIVAKMVFQHGFVHADLHPGNSFFLPGNRVAFIDLGLVATLTDADRRRLALLFYYVAANLSADLARWFYEAAATRRVADYPAYEREIAEWLNHIYDRPLAEVEFTALLAGLYDLLRRHRIRVEATFTVAFIGMMAMEGGGRRLDPQLKFTREVRPYLESALALQTAGPAPQLAPVMAPTTPTSIAAGRYRIRRLLGEGVRKRVYLGRDTRLDRDVAVALIRTEGLDRAGLARINAEARAVAKLADHPRIVPVYDSGEENGVPYVVSQYMGGGTLSGRILRATEQRLPLDMVLRFADQICQALEHAHAHGVIHRDVKPENVWLTEDGFAKLGDFGLARTLGRPSETIEGVTVGTALYMSPEQALGRGVDQRSDLYSLGATLYELATGRPPFEGESVAEVIACHINRNPDTPSRRNPQIPPALDVLVLKLLAKRPEDRFESAAAVRQALRAVSVSPPSAAIATQEEHGIAPAGPGAFVGREREVARLRKGLEEALAGRGRLLVLVGEPGIGKTRAAELLASYAGRRGCAVLVGRSFEGEGAPAFWPWVQIFRSYFEGKDRARLEAELGAGAPYVAQIVPEVREIIPDLPALPAVEGEEARFRLFDAVASFLRRASTTQPLFVLLDDLHWADKPSLLLLQFVTREMSGARLLAVATYRDVEVHHGHPLAEVLPTLRRETAFERVLLRGLPEEDVRALVVALAGTEVPETFVRAINRETEGNPFFIVETVRHLVEEGIVSREGGRWTSRLSPDEIGLPEGIREVIGRRLLRLSEPCRQLLSSASVLGREFEPRILERVAGLDRAKIGELLDEAAGAEIVQEEKRGLVYRFSHALIRETFYADLNAAARVRLHRRIGDAIEEIYADDLDSHLSELAHHSLEAGPAGDVDRAIDLATRAARQAAERFAYEEAAGFYDRAARALEVSRKPDERCRCELLLALGSAEWQCGEFAKSKETILRVAEIAERLHDAEALARAAIAYSGNFNQPIVTVDDTMSSLLEKALAALTPADSTLRAVVLARLAAAGAFRPEQERTTKLLEEALAMAKRVGDERTLLTVMINGVLLFFAPDQLAHRRELGETLRQLGEKLNDEIAIWGAEVNRFATEVEMGHGETARAALEFLERWVAKLREPYLRWAVAAFAAGWASGGAPPTEFEARAQRAVEIGSQGGQHIAALQVFAFQRATALWLQGRAEDAVAIFREPYSTSGFDVPSSDIVAAFLFSEAGKTDQARRLFDSYARHGFRNVVKNLSWYAIVLLAAVVDRLGDRSGAKALYDVLLPYASRSANVGFLVWFGSVSRYLGILARILSRFDDAERHFETALEMDAGLPTLLAQTRYEYGRLLAERSVPGDRAKALTLLSESLEAAQSLGLKKVAADAMALKLSLEGLAKESPRSSIDLIAASLDEKKPDLRPHAAPDGTVTLLFSEIEGLSAMTERLGDRRAHEIVVEHAAIIREQTRTHRGFEVDSQGDGFFLAFSSAERGLDCAIAIQQAFATYNEAHAAEPIRVRIGLHTGEALKEGERFFGKTVILAARIAARARGGEILVSSVVRQLTEGRGETRFGRVRELELKGLTGVHAVSGVAWNGEPPDETADDPPHEITPAAARVFRKSGDFWTIAFDGQSFSLRDSKGLHYIAYLLRNPGREFHALDLVREVSSPGGSEPATAPAGDAGEILDLQAKADYKARLDDLRSEVAEARERNDVARAAKLQEEIDFIAQELSAAYGLGGRARKSGDAAERARKAIQNRVSETITRIRKAHPTLGSHLSQSIRLGLFCTYSADRVMDWLL